MNLKGKVPFCSVLNGNFHHVKWESVQMLRESTAEIDTRTSRAQISIYVINRDFSTLLNIESTTVVIWYPSNLV